MSNLCKCGCIKTKNGKCTNPECTFAASDQAMKAENMVVYRTTDKGEEKEWWPVKVEDVPEFCKDPEQMGMMRRGYAIQHPDDPDAWYVAEKVI